MAPCVGNALKWFPDKRGLAAGITAAGFGAGSALTVAPIQAMIKDSGFQKHVPVLRSGQGIIVVLFRIFPFRAEIGPSPCPPFRAPTSCRPAAIICQPEVMRHPIFWLMYLMFVLVGAGGLMVTANLKPIALDWKIDNTPVTPDGDDNDRGDVRRNDRSCPQRADPAFLRLDLRHDRPREHHVHRFRYRGGVTATG